MYKEPIFLKPEFKERLWGGTGLKEIFQYDIPSDQTGEAWCISGHTNGSNTIQNGPLAGHNLAKAWEEHRELFAHEEGEEFPLLVKILDAAKDLSVQVHPDDTYAREVEGKNYGKTECWYVIDSKEGSEIIFGHQASNKKELQDLVENEEWERLLRRVPVQPGDFFFVPSGTIHAIGAGIQILETQQSSDITYRVYDYDRVGNDGEKRELHLDKSLEVITVPHKDPYIDRSDAVQSDLRQETLVEEEYFSVFHWQLEGESGELKPNPYLLISALQGTGEVRINQETYSFSKGDHFIIPATVDTFELKGNASLIVSRSNKS
ncbi:mannose-6-phosphate isomerase, type 1 [Halobacillus alkaliphilus]|uniref:Mannose-6-phosphate isomerase n=1 Tax=Halobacillus alkaliphilus TaxID=396056 RepID=A0A1I2NK60_9BACI|nr:mannose-6-phosphate isomerase, class I [Halobacillus alkaliphilus]SFG04375.1 mannose-6-phosphate isomerase, type 1 [Halobacillus alkaliphilus]